MRSKKQTPLAIQEELERSILHGLSCEWELAIRGLEPAYAKKMTKPLFSLGNMQNKWAYWSGEKRLICLSRDLVFEHSWDSVREVLLHEMAHQIAEEVLGADGPPHGPVFREACDLIGANPKSSGKHILLYERVTSQDIGSEDKLMTRVRKLMALAQSNNKHEAGAAMAKAHQLIKKYNVDLSEKNNEREFTSLFLGRPGLRHFREHYHLSGLLHEFYFVYCIWVPAYVIEKGKMGNVLEINGTLENVKIASYVYDFVQTYINAQWEKYNRGNSFGRYRKTDFAVGIIEGFRRKLRSRQHKPKNRKKDIVKVKDKKLKQHVAYKYKRVTKVKSKSIRVKKDILNDGIAIGKKMIISKGIEQKRNDRKALITFLPV